MNITLILFLIEIISFVLNRKNIISMLICIGIILLSIAFLILVSSFNFMVILLPLLASRIVGFFGRIIGNNGAKLIASLSVILITRFALVLVFEVALNNTAVDINLSRWLDSDFFNILWDLRFDALTVIEVLKPNYINFAVQQVVKILPSTFLSGKDLIQINKSQFYTSLAINQVHSELDMNPWFITGFSDAESIFIINIIKNNKHKTGWAVNSCFSIGLHKKDKVILEKLKKYFWCR